MQLWAWSTAALAALATGIDACGMSNHVFTATTAMHHLQKTFDIPLFRHALEPKYLPYLQAGAFFPDWGYACSKFNDEWSGLAEDAHWPPFWDAYVAHLKANFPQPWDISKNEELGGLIAFWLGVVSHAVSDISWHSLDGRQGFIEAMRYINYHGDYGDAHDSADTGAEFVLSKTKNLDFFSTIWKFPAKHVSEVYKRMNKTVGSFDLEKCVRIGNVAAVANANAGSFLYPMRVQDSPMLASHSVDYHQGGVDVMSYQIALTWQSIASMLDPKLNGSRFDSSSSQDGLISDMRKMAVSPDRPKIGCSSSLWPSLQAAFPKQLGPINANTVSTNSIWSVMSLLTKEAASSTWQSVSNFFSGMFKSSIWSEMGKSAVPRVSLKSNDDWTEYATSFTYGDFDNDNKTDLVVSLPDCSTKLNTLYHGCVDVHFDVFGKNEKVRMIGSQNGQKFGYGLKTVDLNADGVDDLVVTSAFTAANNKAAPNQAHGHVQIVLGGASFRSLLKDQQQWVTVVRKDETDCQKEFASKLFINDVDGDGHQDLIIGSPFDTLNCDSHQNGVVHVLLSSQFSTMLVKSDTKRFDVREVAVTIQSPASEHYAWFGFDVAFTPSQAGGPAYLAVSAPFAYAPNAPKFGSRPGKVFLYESTNSRDFVLKSTITGHQDKMETGKSLGLVDLRGDKKVQGGGRLYLVIGSPSELIPPKKSKFIELPGLVLKPENKGYQTGSVSIVDVSSLPAEAVTDRLERSMKLVGSDSGQRFGDARTLKFVQNSPELYFGLPHTNKEAGSICHLSLTTLQAKVSVVDEVKAECIKGETNKGLWGSNYEVRQVQGRTLWTGAVQEGQSSRLEIYSF